MTKKRKDLEDVLRNIAGYTLPTYTINDVKYVPLEFADALRDMAKAAIPGDQTVTCSTCGAKMFRVPQQNCWRCPVDQQHGDRMWPD